MDDAEQDSNVASSDSNSIKDKDKKHPIRKEIPLIFNRLDKFIYFFPNRSTNLIH